MIGTFKFYKTSSDRWFIDWPDWLASINDPEMVADTMLHLVSNSNEECHLLLSDESFEDADTITLVTDLSDSVEGGDYYMECYKGDVVKQKIWLCSVTVSVFNNLLHIIYVGYAQII